MNASTHPSEPPNTDRLSPRFSVLVWVAGIVFGWGFALVVVYALLQQGSGPEPATLPAARVTLEEQTPALVSDLDAATPTAPPPYQQP